MIKNWTHPKIAALKLKAKAINSPSYVDANGELHLVDSEGNPVDFRIKVLSKEDRTIEGYLAVFNVIDLCREVVVKGTFAKSIKERGPKSSAKNKIIMLWQHDMHEPIGSFVELKEDDYGLYFKAILDNVPRGLQALEQIASGTLNQFSFGYKYIWDKMKYDETIDAVVLLEVVMYEGSVVSFGCNPETYAIKSLEEFEEAKFKHDEEVETFLKTLPENLRNNFRQLISKQADLSTLAPKFLEMQNQKNSLKSGEQETKGIKWGSKQISFKSKNTKNETKNFSVKW
jgi:HK97 family phage prohead protease